MEGSRNHGQRRGIHSRTLRRILTSWMRRRARARTSSCLVRLGGRRELRDSRYCIIATRSSTVSKRRYVAQRRYIAQTMYSADEARRDPHRAPEGGASSRAASVLWRGRQFGAQPMRRTWAREQLARCRHAGRAGQGQHVGHEGKRRVLPWTAAAAARGCGTPDVDGQRLHAYAGRLSHERLLILIASSSSLSYLTRDADRHGGRDEGRRRQSGGSACARAGSQTPPSGLGPRPPSTICHLPPPISPLAARESATKDRHVSSPSSLQERECPRDGRCGPWAARVLQRIEPVALQKVSERQYVLFTRVRANEGLSVAQEAWTAGDCCPKTLGSRRTTGSRGPQARAPGPPVAAVIRARSPKNKTPASCDRYVRAAYRTDKLCLYS